MSVEFAQQLYKRIDVDYAYRLVFSKDEDIVIAQHDFNPTNESDLPFKKGEKLKIIHEWVEVFIFLTYSIQEFILN